MSETPETPSTETPPQPKPNESAPATTETLLAKPAEAAAPEPFSLEKLEVPEGFALTDEVKTSLGELATKHSLPHAAVSELAGLYFAEVKAMQERLTGAIDTTWTETQTAWTNEVYEKFGGETGALAAAGRFAPIIDQFGGPALREALNVTGFGNHPAAFAMFAALAGKLGEATPVGSQAAPKAAPNPLDTMYPSMTKKG